MSESFAPANSMTTIQITIPDDLAKTARDAGRTSREMMSGPVGPTLMMITSLLRQCVPGRH
jgi:hypothetical protein